MFSDKKNRTANHKYTSFPLKVKLHLTQERFPISIQMHREFTEEHPGDNIALDRTDKMPYFASKFI